MKSSTLVGIILWVCILFASTAGVIFGVQQMTASKIEKSKEAIPELRMKLSEVEFWLSDEFRRYEDRNTQWTTFYESDDRKRELANARYHSLRKVMIERRDKLRYQLAELGYDAPKSELMTYYHPEYR